MIKIWLLMTIVALALAACGNPAGPIAMPTEVTPTSPPVPTETPAPTPAPGAAERAAMQALAALLGIDLSAITLREIEAVDWPDSCLGLARINAICAQGIVPGFNLILEANGQAFEVHTDGDGSAWTLAPTSGGPQAEAAERAAVSALLAALGLADYEVMVVSTTAVEWNNSCLGVELPDTMCSEVITPGYKIVLESNNVLYHYHTNQDGSAVAPAVLALTWEREGGIAGFSDRLLVYRSGEVLSQVGGDGPRWGSLAELADEDAAPFRAWLADMGSVSIAQDDPPDVSDRMTISLQLAGLGQGQPTADEQQAMLDWAQDLHYQMQTP